MILLFHATFINGLDRFKTNLDLTYKKKHNAGEGRNNKNYLNIGRNKFRS